MTWVLYTLNLRARTALHGPRSIIFAYVSMLQSRHGETSHRCKLPEHQIRESENRELVLDSAHTMCLLRKVNLCVHLLLLTGK